jgi:SPP1 family predicted phage head-tail adaptor
MADQKARPMISGGIPYIDPGALRTPITIQAPSTAQDGFGQQTTTWRNLLCSRAKVDALKQDQQQRGGELVSQVTHRITMRWPGSGVVINSGCRVLCGASTYLVQAVDNFQQRNIMLHLLVMEINGSA